MTTTKKWSKLHFRSADGEEKNTMFAVSGYYDRDVRNAKKELKAVGYSFIRLGKTYYNAFGEIIK